MGEGSLSGEGFGDFPFSYGSPAVTGLQSRDGVEEDYFLQDENPIQSGGFSVLLARYFYCKLHGILIISTARRVNTCPHSCFRASPSYFSIY